MHHVWHRFRRFHGTLDEGIITRWAHFCAGFVECFRNDGLAARLLQAASEAEALAELAAQQERATPAQLMGEMAGFVHPGTAEYFMRDSGAAPLPAGPS